MSHPQATNFEALGLRDQSPFAILKRPRAKPKACATKKKTVNLPKVQQSINALETPEETEIRLAANKAAKTAKVLRKNSYSDAARSTTADKTNAIVGRRNSARSQ